MRVALSEGRLSKWQQLLEELTYHDLAVLQAYAKIEPFGERRADMRQAWNTSAIIGALSLGGDPPDPEKLMDYLAKPDEEAAQSGFTSPNSAASMMSQMFPGTVK